MRRTRKELKAEIQLLRSELSLVEDMLADEQRKFTLVNDRCGKTLAAINKAREALNDWQRGV